MKEASGGRLIIEPYAGGQLVPLTEMLEAVGAGTVDASFTTPAYWVGKIPACAFGFGIPYLLLNQTDNNIYYHVMGAEDVLREEYAKFNVHLCRIAWVDSQNYLFSSKPVYKISDFEGLKMRTVGLAQALMAKVGASVVNIPREELYMALELGTLDATTLGPVTVVADLKLYEVARYVLSPACGGSISPDFFVNKDKWEALPDDLKAITNQTVNAYFAQFSNDYPYLSLKKLRELIDAGEVEMVNMEPEEVKKIEQLSLEVLAEAAKKDAASAEMYQILNDFLRLTGFID
jgi:TRAP-type mannitol/chloroaromatic compound transport system substrate-binding protein